MTLMTIWKPGLIFIYEISSQHRKIGKCLNEFIISFRIAMDHFSFPVFTSANNKEYKGFQWGKATVKVSLLFAQSGYASKFLIIFY